MSTKNPSAAVVVREHNGQPFFEAKFRYRSRQVKRRVGPAWLDLDTDTGDWRPRRGRVPEGSYDQRAAHVAAASLVDAYVAEADDRERTEREHKARGVTFREVAHEYLRWLEDVKGAKPATLRNHLSVLADPGVPYKRGKGTTTGHVMTALGNRPASRISTRDVEELLATVSATGVSPRTVNKHRAVICAAFNYGCRASTYGLSANPASEADKRREPLPGALVYYSPEEVEALARALADGRHREPSRQTLGDQEREARHAEDQQDAELVRVAAYAGLCARRAARAPLARRGLRRPCPDRGARDERGRGVLHKVRQGPSGAIAGPSRGRSRSPEQARGFHRSRRASVLQRARTNPRQLRVATPLQAGARRRRPAAAALP